MNIVLERKNNAFEFEAKADSGTVIKMDASESIGGQNLGMRPMEVLASSLAGCSSIDILNILYKQKQQVEHYSVELNAIRSDEMPGVFKKIHLSIYLKGTIDMVKAQRAADLSFEKYCSVSKMLEPLCEITYRVFVNSKD
jgi:putative redox protein